MIGEMLKFDPKQRPKVSEVRDHVSIAVTYQLKDFWRLLHIDQDYIPARNDDPQDLEYAVSII